MSSLLFRSSSLFLLLVLSVLVSSFTFAHDGSHLDFVIDYPMVDNGTVIPLDAADYADNEVVIRFNLPRLPLGGNADDSKRIYVKFTRNDTYPSFLTFDESNSNTTSVTNCMRFRTRVGAPPRPERPSGNVYETYKNTTSMAVNVGSCDFYIEVKPGFYDPQQTSDPKCVVSFVLGKMTCDSACQSAMKTTCDAELNYEARVNHAMATTSTSGFFFAMILLMVLSFLMSF
ncbi:hypothetical protein FDP41_005314 [Naegleria fowleri]|uniref:Pherophorin domain-containing protein n=1 Tax=Naegleria fowleri TaxID=5763 RepID=A0A6A5BG69_NAEFO|nr:uncharacterized protein FDP41_005314 [Naegleria fowleri]KAF0975987.1 hypothetical protein FDP41_005314 [Naegleria fowleri]